MNIQTKCYGKIDTWNSREEAIAYFWEGVCSSEGSERDRYLTIISKLERGMTFASDEED